MRRLKGQVRKPVATSVSEAPALEGMTWEQQQYWAADVQTAEYLYNEKDWEGVVKHVGHMYGLTEKESLVRPGDITIQEQAARCMKLVEK